MKVWINQQPSEAAGGLYRVVRGLYEYLPEYGVEIVEDINQADVAHYHISLFGQFANIPKVVSSHGMLWEEHGWGKLGDKVNKECLDAYRKADVVTSPSDFVARAISRYTLANSRIVRHGIDASIWVPGTSQGYVLWNKARVDPANNPEEVFKLASSTSEIQYISTQGKSYKNIKVVPHIPADEMLQYIQSAAVYLDTPLESGGPCFGVLEAMSCGVPVLAWNFGGNAESVIHGETGYLANPGDYADLKRGLYYCLEERERLGTNARQYVSEAFTIEQNIEGYVQAYREAIRENPVEVSVIIPCYNLGKFLPHCIDSVLEQDHESFEVVIVDDASTDNSWEIIKAYAKQDSRIIPLRNSVNLHVSASRNRAVENSKGKFILPLDADDRLEPNALSLLSKRLKEGREDIVAGHLRIYNENDLNAAPMVGGWPNNVDPNLQLGGYNRLPYSSMFTRKLFNRLGGYRTRIRCGVEDADFWTRAFSYGYEAHLIDEFTLKYTHREKSLGKINDKGSDVWLDWYPWAYGNSPAQTTKVKSFYPPEISVVIPVGPGHDKYIQTCIDSLIAQTFDNWEVIVVNDSDVSLNVPSFVRLINNEGNKGVAYSRNVGVQAALANKIVFLDADDIAQPGMLDVLLVAQASADGWVYGDWFINVGKENPEYSESEDWDFSKIIGRSLGPITGLYMKSHIIEVGGFDEDAPGWEDWDFHLKLVSNGICGTRVKYPLITYNMLLGDRREDNFRNQENLIKYIKNKHKNLRKFGTMGCSKCGGKRTVVVEQSSLTDVSENTVLIEYLGEVSKQRINSPTHKGTVYQINKNRPRMLVFKEDLSWFLGKRLPNNTPAFKVIEQPKQTEVSSTVLTSDEVPARKLLLEDSGLDEKLITLLKTKFHSIDAVKQANDNEILAISGIGPARLTEIRESL
jgi:glycosyltransferase involved in cell wall biosynthesis